MTQPGSTTSGSGFPMGPDHGLQPGDFVRHPQAPDWGLGQVQSVVGANVTVNFEERGNLMINTAVVQLVAASACEDAGRSAQARELAPKCVRLTRGVSLLP